MTDIAGFPYIKVEFKKDGNLEDQADAGRARSFVADEGLSDLFVISHGWNNDMADAASLYERFFAEVRAAIDAGTPAGLNGRAFGVLGLLWPSKKFADDELVPGNANSAGGPVPDAAVIKQLEMLKGGFDSPTADADLDRMKLLVPKLQDSPKAQREFADLARSLPAPKQTQGHADDAEEGSDGFFSRPGDRLLAEAGKPFLAARPPRSGGGGGGAGAGRGGGSQAAGLGDFFSGIKAGARNVLNYTTYYQMKERAGIVGKGGAYALLRQVRNVAPQLKLHLIGHSFGGRLVTAAADGPDGQPPVGASSMTLLQAAFSHNGFAQKFHKNEDGFFRKVVSQKKVAGPILVSHSVLDKAVGTAYPLASRFAGQDSSALGDKNDRFGGIGRNGAQNTPEAIDGVLTADGGYAFEAGKVYNLNADARITGHSDICKREVAIALLSAVAVT